MKLCNIACQCSLPKAAIQTKFGYGPIATRALFAVSLIAEEKVCALNRVVCCLKGQAGLESGPRNRKPLATRKFVY